MALRDIRILEEDTDGVLRKICKPVGKIDDKIRLLLQDLVDTLKSTDNGAGLAAPQIGILRRMIAVNTPQGLLQMVNPEVVEAIGEHEVVEGCLSVPGEWGKLMRPVKVVVKALNENGEEFFTEGEGDIAKLLCHEIDHLDGILFIDKVTEFIDDTDDDEEE